MSGEPPSEGSTELLRHERCASPAGDRADAGAASAVPDRIGRYRVLAKLGEGGMGVVYEAEQDSPRRRVAVKVVRGGRTVDELSTRMFQREVDVLARLQHPHIGAIYESGRTEDGRPFFAMELVRGRTLDAYLAARGPVESADEVRFRLMLFRRITDAVHYAHQRGVIHRDLKPSNIVVSEEATPAASPWAAASEPAGVLLPEVKILDFGLARITEGDIAMTLATEVGVIKGTLPYMAPEQARGAPDEIDVRTDVYALGVVLYEMLSSRRPYDVMKTALVEALRVVCEVPPAPLRETMRRSCRLDQDVETIVGKALEKEVDRRYPSAAALSQDIGRYLTSLPILARPPSAAYQLQKFAARNRALVGGIVATFITLVAGVVVATVFGLREAAERREAERARRDLEAVVEFQSGMLSGIDAEEVGRRLTADLHARVSDSLRARGVPDREVESAAAAFGRAVEGVNSTNVALRLIDEEILARAATAIEAQFGDQPLIRARLRDTIGETYSALGLDDRAEPHLASSLSIRRTVLGDDDPATLTSVDHLAILYWHQGRYDEALAMAEKNLAARTRILGEAHQDTLASANTLAMVYASLGRLGDAEQLYERTLTAQRSSLGQEDPATLTTMNNLGVLYRDLGRYSEAEPLLVEALERRIRVTGPAQRETDRVRRNLIALYRAQGRNDDVRPLTADMLETARVFAERDDALSVEINDYAWLLLTVEPTDLRDPARALEVAQRACAREEERGGRELWNFLDTLALAWSMNGEPAKAVAAERRALKMLEADRPERAGISQQLAAFEAELRALGKTDSDPVAPPS